MTERWCNPDFEKLRLATYTDEIGDDEALKKFGSSDLGGPSGPRNQAELDRYPSEVREQIAQIVRDELGFNSIADFVNAWLDERNPEGQGTDFGKGLTHEISKALAQRRLLRCLNDKHPHEHFVWDAVGNADAYIAWIEDALNAGYKVRVVYVRCDLAVAQRRAAERPRRLAPITVKATYQKAQDAAERIRTYVQYVGDTERLEFLEEITDDEHERAAARAAGYTEDGRAPGNP